MQDRNKAPPRRSNPSPRRADPVSDNTAAFGGIANKQEKGVRIMFIYTLFTLAGTTISQTPLQMQAVRAARAYTAAHHAPCVLECRSLATDEARRVLLNTDGSIVKLWQAA